MFSSFLLRYSAVVQALSAVLVLTVACSDVPSSDRTTAVAVGPVKAAIDSMQLEGEERYAEGEFEAAQASFETALSLAREVGDSSSMGRSLTWQAQVSWRLGDYEATRRLGEEALAIKLEAQDPEDLFRSYNVLGLLAWNESRPLDATRLFGEAALAAEAAADTSSLAKVWNNMGLVQTSLGEYQSARSGFEAARSAAASVGDPLIEGRILINLGMLDLEVGAPAEAVGQLEAAAPLLREADDAVGQQVLLGHLGTAYAALGDPGRATLHLDSALRLARTAGLRQEEAINLEQIAELHREAGDHRRALQLFAEAREINEEMGLVDEVAIDLRSEAEIHTTLGDEQLALEKLRRALATHVEIGYPMEQVHDLVELAQLSARIGWPDSASLYLSRATSAAGALDSRRVRISIGLGRARVARALNRPEEVLTALAEVQPELKSGAYVSEWEAEALRAWAFSAAGQLDSAAAAGERAIVAVERVRLRYGSGALRAAHLAAREDAYTGQVAVQLRMGLVGAAFETADRARGRSLLEQMSAREDAGRRGTATDDMVSGEQLLRRIDDLADRVDEIESIPLGERTEEMRTQARDLQGQLEASRSDYSQTVLQARSGDPRGTVILGGGRVDRMAIASSLRPDEALLEYLLTPRSIVIFALTRDSIRYFSTEIERSTLASRVRVARAAVGDITAGNQSHPVALARLYENLIQPVESSGFLDSVARLLIVPHAELTYLPFTALLNPSTGRYAVQDRVVTHLPSASVLPVLRETAPVAAPHASGLAPFPDELPASGAELAMLARAIPGTETFRGDQATERRFRQVLASERVVHIATHGYLNARHPMSSRLDLVAASTDPADDGRFEVHELLELHVRSPIVYLSGCETGVGADWSTSYARGEDYATLSRAFLYAGAESVVATLWPIVDESASLFAQLFYHGAPGLDVGGALAAAQRAMIADERYSAPYHWAAYRLSGRSDLHLPAQ